ncbi:hypothetical protein E2P81_ATG05639 [Venturia nashicola]|uniref:Uncharacterized protein n=1 Tax=Venturia nashicola TaxID=86259 RepID=A0A4Z1PGC2_9PEZI|nr:hypothetical protein E6O75_ATG05777 [Venturia nashicola]TLD32663.1 hypothetical protein E2P81_ATG05639 [Venturia nashicola]
MVVVRKWGENHINKSLKQIDSNTWLIGGFVLHRSPFPSNTATWNDDGDNSSYTLKQAPIPATAPTASPYIKLVHEAGGWIRTKFRLSSGMDLSTSATTNNQTWWWRAEVQKALGANGFEDYAQAWMEWQGYKKNEQ